MGNKTPCLGAHSGSLNKTLVARTRKLGASGDRAPVRQQPWATISLSGKVSLKEVQFEKLYVCMHL